MRSVVAGAVDVTTPPARVRLPAPRFAASSAALPPRRAGVDSAVNRLDEAAALAAAAGRAESAAGVGLGADFAFCCANGRG